MHVKVKATRFAGRADIGCERERSLNSWGHADATPETSRIMAEAALGDVKWRFGPVKFETPSVVGGQMSGWDTESLGHMWRLQCRRGAYGQMGLHRGV